MSLSRKTAAVLWIAGFLFVVGSSASAQEAPFEEQALPSEEQSLYDRLGGEPAITAVVADFVGRAASDPAVNFTRQGKKRTFDPTPENIEKLKKHLVQFVCSVAGGPQVYEGMDMKEAHEEMEITDAEFDAIAADLKASLDSFSVPEKEENELLAAVGTLRGSIVEQQEAPDETE